MSVQFGVWNFDGKPVDQTYLEKVSPILAPYAPDGSGLYIKENVALLYHSFHTTSESLREKQPCVLPSDAVLTWDGRLDNRGELIGLLADVLTAQSTDVEIVAAAYQHWGNNCFAKLLGDWALAIWDSQLRSLVLARDFVGKRQLYYSADEHRVVWSTVLDPLVMFADKQFTLCEEYVAGWLGLFPAAHLTPYIGIQAVPPSSFIAIEIGKQKITKYWHFDPSRRIRYRTDGEYEECFREVFRQAVQRNLRSHTTVGAHLSGGMDSTSIVCVADSIFAEGQAGSPTLDTISYFDDSEPNWNERPYFTLVEQKRGRVGCHIDLSTAAGFSFERSPDTFPVTPASAGRPADERFTAFLSSRGIRVILGGTGGDESTGGVPTPAPELEDLIATFDARRLAHQLKVWALNKKKPWFHLFSQALSRFLPAQLVRTPENRRPAPWLDSGFVSRNLHALNGYEIRLKLFGPLPSFQENLATLDGLCRQLGSSPLPSRPVYEMRYPYLDRDLLEFLYAIPREQLVRPGQRRSVMRRALVGIVPDEILNRRRKASVSRKPAIALQLPATQLGAQDRILLAEKARIIDSNRFLKALEQAPQGLQVPLVKLWRTLAVEYWLVGLQQQGLPNSIFQSSAVVSQPVRALSTQYISGD